MASRFGHAGGIPERRVRPIWDAIDSRQFKNASKLVNTLLTKYPYSAYALALKALILERTGKLEEALSICMNAKELLEKTDAFLMDDLTLSTLQIVFQRLDRLDLATSCYECACGKFLNNLELMMGLFNCYVREYSFVKQQQMAIKMYKLAGEERYLLWAVCSIQLQVCFSEGEAKLLVLAEGLIRKHIASHGLHEPEALTVYISILEQQEKYVDALEILSGNLGSLILIDVDRLRLQGRLLARAGDLAAAASTYQKVLEICPDDWECFKNYVGCLLGDKDSWCSGTNGLPVQPPNSVECSANVTEDMLDSCISDASAFVQKLKSEASCDSLRGPCLASLEIERRKHLHGKGDRDRFFDELVHYFIRFGHLACFCSDIEAFHELLTPSEALQLLEKLVDIYKMPSVPVPPIKYLGQSITLWKMRELFSSQYDLSVSELEGHAVEMMDIYCRSLSLSKDLDPQESMHGEELLSMASNTLVKLFWRTGQLGYWLEAVMILEFGLSIRRFVSQYKILLVHLYSHFGALPLAYNWYRTLDVKNILLESVLHHILPQMLISPLWVETYGIVNDYLKFLGDHLKESADLTFLAYRHRNYSKAIEFVQFKERLHHSNQYLFTRVESSILRLKEASCSLDDEESVLEAMKCGTEVLDLVSKTACSSLTFNEDFHTRPWWTPTPEKSYLLGPFEVLPCFTGEKLEECKRCWEANSQKIVKKRSLLPRMIYLSIQCASASSKERTKANGSIFDSRLCTELKSLLEQYATNLGYSVSDAVKVLVEVTQGKQSVAAFGSDIVDWMNFAVFLNAWSLTSQDLGCLGEWTAWHVVNSVMAKCILEKIKMTSPLVCSPGGAFPTLVKLIAESLAWHSLVLQSCVRSSLPCGKKKKKSGPVNQSNSLSHDIRDTVQALFGVLEVVSKWLTDQINCVNDKNTDLLIASFENGGQNGGSGSGRVFQVLKEAVLSADQAVLGDRIYQAIKPWSPGDVARRITDGQHRMLSELLQTCRSKVKVLEYLKQQIGA